MSVRPTVRILGTHGVPASYGGFETAAEQVGLHLRAKGWRVIVYCQVAGDGPITQDTWEDLERVIIPERREGWLGTSSFDLKSVRHALAQRGPDEVWLTFGYNTGVFDILPRLRRIPNVINMDGMEWTRARWGPVKQGILLGNERIAGWVGDLIIADHPEIARYLRRHFGARRVVTIAYGAHEVTSAPTDPVHGARAYAGRLRHGGLPADPGELGAGDRRCLGPAAPGDAAAGGRPVRRGGSVRPTGPRRQRRRRCGSPGRSSTRTGSARCASTPPGTCTATPSAAPTRRWSRRWRPAMRWWRTATSTTAGSPVPATPTSPPTDDLAVLLDDLGPRRGPASGDGRVEPGALPGRVHLGAHR